MENVIEAVSFGEKEPGVYEYSIESSPDVDLRRNLFAMLTRNGWPLLALKNTDLTLEDVFLRLTGDNSYASGNNRKVGK